MIKGRRAVMQRFVDVRDMTVERFNEYYGRNANVSRLLGVEDEGMEFQHKGAVYKIIKNKHNELYEMSVNGIGDELVIPKYVNKCVVNNQLKREQKLNVNVEGSYRNVKLDTKKIRSLEHHISMGNNMVIINEHPNSSIHVNNKNVRGNSTKWCMHRFSNTPKGIILCGSMDIIDADYGKYAHVAGYTISKAKSVDLHWFLVKMCSEYSKRQVSGAGSFGDWDTIFIDDINDDGVLTHIKLDVAKSDTVGDEEIPLLIPNKYALDKDCIAYSIIEAARLNALIELRKVSNIRVVDMK